MKKNQKRNTPRILIASSNPGKIVEITKLLDDIPIEIITPVQLNLNIFVNETGNSYRENAAIKALSYARTSNFFSIADDTGLEVKELGGLPGLKSARFSPKQNATDKDRREYLLELLKEKPKPWKASFFCVISVASPSGDTCFGEGVCQGEIISEQRGKFGFGYDPIFLVRGLSKTMAELSLDEKNHISHRAKAVHAVKPHLMNFIENG